MSFIARSLTLAQRHLQRPILCNTCVSVTIRTSPYCASLSSEPTSSSPPPQPPLAPWQPLMVPLPGPPPPPSAARPRQAWIENMDMVEERKLGMVELHPEVFAVFPKLHLIHQNVRWQQLYGRVDHATTKTRAEVHGGGRKPWPQKGTGRARHSSIRSPLWRGGGVSHGPRGPKTHFYMLSHAVRVGGLCATLSVKLAQGDLRVVADLQLPSPAGGYLLQLAEHRRWGPSVLFVNDTDEAVGNVARALAEVPHFNLLPVYGLNVYSMLKHTTLVLTTAALERVQERLLTALTMHQSAAMTRQEARLMK